MAKKNAKKNYTKETVFIQDAILIEHTSLLLVGVRRNPEEIHLEFYFVKDGQMLHRDIEVQPDGSYDSGCITDPEAIAEIIGQHLKIYRPGPRPAGKCPKCGKRTKKWMHVSGAGHLTGDFSKDEFVCEKCYDE